MRGNTVAFVVQGHAATWLGYFPSSMISAPDKKMGLMHFAGSGGKADWFRTDGIGELSARSEARLRSCWRSTTLFFLRHGVYLGGHLPFGAAIGYKPGSNKGKSSSQYLAPRTVRSIFACYRQHSGGLRRGGCLVYDEE